MRGSGLAVWPRRVGSYWIKRVRYRIPQLEVLEDAFDDVGIINECNDAHGGTAVGALERIDLVHLLNQPGPVGHGLCSSSCCPECLDGGYWVLETNRFFRNSSDAARLLMPDGSTVVDSFEYSSSTRGQSWCRSPDGGAWQQTPCSPSREAAN